MARYLWFVVCLVACFSGNAEAYDVCGPLQNAYGPYDYRTRRDKLGIVEGAHFTDSVRTLERGHTGSLGGDIDYTLRAFPNHPVALNAMANLSIREKKDRPRGAHYTVECYFDRAIRFAPNDADVYMVYGNWLFKIGERAKAIKQYKMGETFDPNNANLEYNLGLAYVDAKDYDNALLHARRAYELGFQLPGLREKLAAAGKWRDEAPKSPAGAAQRLK
jgi:tetratricopeptide (TPR) repeat protein